MHHYLLLRLFVLVSISISISISACGAAEVNFETDRGAKADDDSLDTAWANGKILNETLASLKPGDKLVVPNKTFTLMGGIISANLTSVVISIDGTLSFTDKDIKGWPTSDGKNVLHCLDFIFPRNVTFTAKGKGTLEGNGAKWWGIPGIGYLERGENRPRLMQIDSGTDILVENLFFHNSPYWTFWADSAQNLEIRFSDIVAKRSADADTHNVYEMSAFNTDGFDVSGDNVWIHDVNVWNQDDSICAKDGSTNMVFERINASGVGLTIGSIGDSTNDNITFRDIRMHHTEKGVYMKFRGNGVISNVVYENIYMDAPEQWAIWIGPAQQSDSGDLCAAHPCSICWPEAPSAKCTPTKGQYINITLRNFTVNNAKQSPGVILSDPSTPMKGLVFDNVVFNNPGYEPWDEMHWKCEGAGDAVATGTTWPVPPCFEDKTIGSAKYAAAAARKKSAHGQANFSLSAQVRARMAAGATSAFLDF